MNIVVAVKQIPDLSQIRIKNRQPVLEGVPYTLSLIDKNALEVGALLKEVCGANLIIVSVGNEEIEETVKEALAAGADKAYLVINQRFRNMDSSISAMVLAAVIKRIDNVGLLLFGEGSGDNYSGQVSSRVAEILGLPQVGYASRIDLKGYTATITRSLEDSEEVIEVKLPVVVSILGDINEPCLPSISQIMKAGCKPKEIMELGDLDLDLPENAITTLSLVAPETDRKRVAVKNITDLISTLQAEGLGGVSKCQQY